MKLMEEKHHKWYIEVDYDEFKRSGSIVHKAGLVPDVEIAKEVIGGAPDNGFQIFRNEIEQRALSLLGSKGKILAHLICKKDNDNILQSSIKYIAKDTGTSIQTVMDFLDLFLENGLISVKVCGYERRIFVNPGLGHRGSRFRERKLLNEMEIFDKEAKKERKNRNMSEEAK